MDDIIGKVHLHGAEREVCVRDLFAQDHVAVAIVASEAGGFVGPYGEGPNLELLCGYVLILRRRSDLNAGSGRFHRGASRRRRVRPGIARLCR